jgi:Na+/proline symporter
MLGTTAWLGIILIAILLTSLPVYLYSRGYGNTKVSFLLSNRNLLPIVTGISLGMAWANSPSIFIASGQAYNVGLVGWFWFVIGNILTLAVFGLGAQKVAKAMPEGYTMAGYLKTTHGTYIHKCYLFCSLVVSLLVMCIGLVAICTLISITSEISKFLASLIIVGIAATLSFRSGFRATVLVELAKFSIAALGFGTILYLLSTSPAIQTLTAGLPGIKGNGAELFGTETAWTVFATFGIITFLGQMCAPWVDNNFMQRGFAYGGDKKKMFWSYILGALAFGVFPLATGLIAFYGVANPVIIPNGQGQYAIVHIIDQLVGNSATVAFCIIALISSIAIVDDQLNNFSDLVKNDIIDAYKIDEQKSLMYTRMAALGFAVLGITIINIPFVNLLYVLLLGNIIRAAMGLTTVGLIFRPKNFDGKITGAVLVASLILTGIGFNYITINGLKEYILPLTIASFFGTPLLSIILSKLKTR